MLSNLMQFYLFHKDHRKWLSASTSGSIFCKDCRCFQFRKLKLWKNVTIERQKIIPPQKLPHLSQKNISFMLHFHLENKWESIVFLSFTRIKEIKIKQELIPSWISFIITLWLIQWYSHHHLILEGKLGLGTVNQGQCLSGLSSSCLVPLEKFCP